MVLSRCDNRIIKPWKIFDSKFGDSKSNFGSWLLAVDKHKTSAAESQRLKANCQSKKKKPM
jgi:hypothetical protein